MVVEMSSISVNDIIAICENIDQARFVAGGFHGALTILELMASSPEPSVETFAKKVNAIIFDQNDPTSLTHFVNLLKDMEAKCQFKEVSIQ